MDDNPPLNTIYYIQDVGPTLHTRKSGALDMTRNASEDPDHAVYHIYVKGLLDEEWSCYLSNFKITHHAHGISMLVGTVRDQAELFGLLLKIRDLGIPLIAIEPIAQETLPMAKPDQCWITRICSTFIAKVRQNLIGQKDETAVN